MVLYIHRLSITIWKTYAYKIIEVVIMYPFSFLLKYQIKTAAEANTMRYSDKLLGELMSKFNLPPLIIDTFKETSQRTIFFVNNK